MLVLGSGCKYRLSLAERFDCTETIINQCAWIIQKPPPPQPLLFVEKLSSMKLVPGAKKVGDRCSALPVPAFFLLSFLVLQTSLSVCLFIFCLYIPLSSSLPPSLSLSASCSLLVSPVSICLPVSFVFYSKSLRLFSSTDAQLVIIWNENKWQSYT